MKFKILNQLIRLFSFNYFITVNLLRLNNRMVVKKKKVRKEYRQENKSK